jgi:hypothetical protein
MEQASWEDVREPITVVITRQYVLYFMENYVMGNGVFEGQSYRAYIFTKFQILKKNGVKFF